MFSLAGCGESSWAAALELAHAAAAVRVAAAPAAQQQRAEVQVNSSTHRPQKLKCLISRCTNPVSVLSLPYSNRPLKPLTRLNRLNAIFVLAVQGIAKSPCLFDWSMSSAIDLDRARRGRCSRAWRRWRRSWRGHSRYKNKPIDSVLEEIYITQ